MRSTLLPLLLAVACDTGGKIEIGDGETDTTAVVDTDGDTDGGGGGGTNGGGNGGTNGGVDTDPGDSDPTPVDSDSDGGGGGGTNGGTNGGTSTNPFDAPKLAWDGTVVVTNVPFVGTRNCVDRFTETGDELFSGSRYNQLKSACPTCARFFEIRSTGTTNCLSTYEAGSWAGVELRPTGVVAVSTFYLDDLGQLQDDTKTPGALVGATFTYTDSFPGLPTYKTTRERAEITLTPVP